MRKFLFFSALFIITALTGFLLTYTRYTNQNVLLSNFNFFKTANLIGNGIFLLILIAIIINLFSRKEYRLSGLIVIFCTSLVSFVLILLMNKIEEKDAMLVTGIIFSFINIYIFISLLALSISGSKKVHYFSNFFWSLILFVLMTGIIFTQVYYFKDDAGKYQYEPRRADAGVILGAAVWGGKRPSPVLLERINKGYEIYSKKYVSKLVLTGGGYPGDRTESEVEKSELVRKNVDPKDLIVEDKSNSTFEQIVFVRDKLYRKNGWNRIIIVSDNFHLFRSSEICKFNDINVDCISSETPLSTEGYFNYCLKESFAVLFYWVFGIG